jgi:hypothetical protein
MKNHLKYLIDSLSNDIVRQICYELGNSNFNGINKLNFFEKQNKYDS